MRRAEDARGFTLLEVTITVAIVFLILGVLAAVYPALTSASDTRTPSVTASRSRWAFNCLRTSFSKSATVMPCC